MGNKTPITVAHGDGIGPEIMDATLKIIQAAGAQIEIEQIEVGEKVYLRGISAGIEPSAWESLRRTKVFLKAPITTPQGGGYKSLNVTTRTTFGLYANIRPCVSYYPFVDTKHPKMNVVIVRENEEDTYTGIEYRQTQDMMECLKLISRPGSEKIVRYAFEYARSNNRKKVTCFVKDNIMKQTDGLFHTVFDEIAKEYPDIENESWIVDIGSAKLADTPEAFDVIVMPNLYGDILSDVAAQIAGSVGLAGSANIGEQCAMFEAIHGSAPRRAGQNVANPSGLLLAAVMLLVHINQPDVATKVHNAWLRTMEDGVHTYDIFAEGVSKQKVGTREFADAVIARLGQEPQTLSPVHYSSAPQQVTEKTVRPQRPKANKELVGVDVFLDWTAGTADQLGELLSTLNHDGLELTLISNRGARVWPNGQPETFTTDHWRSRFLSQTPITHAQITALLQKVSEQGLDFIKTENLYNFDGKAGYSSVSGA
ncbi:NADP-dependent isocitrate dehydrogenase [Tengunoibacter tsumagoiensis]|uniref:Isocitrate dehydrogenase [NADP] n=1 Tax=Tengunoibacter tsumagoiensis TaxID=2014871 RepID=A0A402A592_9CHLR|nr:NADP-dependent isocitrate dehydrogenase [Tengunoibacter tsumagoiensis]GCE14272.1 isocitrate dehydrogenase [Tengunoibacter tsumagoiensis]